MSSDNRPLVSIIIPTYNRSGLLRDTLTSIALQSCKDWEALVVDDNSVDDTKDAVLSFSADSSNFIYLKNETFRKGANVCRNIGLNQASGKYVIFLDSDDLLAQTCIENRVRAIESEKEADFVVFQCHKFIESPETEDIDLWCEWTNRCSDIDAFLSGQVLWQTAGPIWRAHALKALGPWNEDLLCDQDFEFHMRALAHQLKYKKINSIDYFWRKARQDSISDFQAKKDKRATGAVSQCFFAVLDILMSTQAITAERKRLLQKRARRIMIDILLFGGQSHDAFKVLKALSAHRCLSGIQYFEHMLVLLFWRPVMGKIPSLSYLNWRFGDTQEF